MFMTDSGIPTPDGIKLSDNPFINIVKDYANVDLEIEKPSYQEYKTKFDLLLASGQLPDIVHTMYAADAIKRADEGAFLDLKKYYDQSPLVQKIITPEMMELAKSPSGHYYRIPMAANQSPQGKGLLVRFDLVKKYNNGKWPESVEEWADLMRKIKKAEPDSVVLTNRVNGQRVLSYGGIVFYTMYGAEPYSVRVQDGKVYSTFQLPEYREATELMRQLYEEGVLDKEFAVNDLAKWQDKYVNKNVLMSTDDANQVLPFARNLKQGKTNPNTVTQEIAFAPPLKKYPSVLKDPKYTYSQLSLPINSHGLYISSKTKDRDRAWKVIEGFATEQLREAIFWGKEGETYTAKDGKRSPIVEKLNDPSRSWSLQLALIPGYTAGREVGDATVEQVLGADYTKTILDSMKAVADQAAKAGLGFWNFEQFPKDVADQVDKKGPEANDFISKATVEAIMGKITMRQFDDRVKEFTEKYGFIFDEHTKYITAHKDELRKKGVMEVEW
ncbi:hypothetical protein GCM10020370_20480 [Paenibacillus hodogayensis]